MATFYGCLTTRTLSIASCGSTLGQTGFCLMQRGHLVFLVAPPGLGCAQPVLKYSIKHLYLHGKPSQSFSPAQVK